MAESWSCGVRDSWSLGLLGFCDGYLGVHFLDSSLVYKVIQLIINLFLAVHGPIPDSDLMITWESQSEGNHRGRSLYLAF